MKLPNDAPIVAVPMCVKPIDGQNYHTVGEKYLTGLIDGAGVSAVPPGAGAGAGAGRAAGPGRRGPVHRQSVECRGTSLCRRAGPAGIAAGSRARCRDAAADPRRDRASGADPLHLPRLPGTRCTPLGGTLDTQVSRRRAP